MIWNQNPLASASERSQVAVDARAREGTREVILGRIPGLRILARRYAVQGDVAVRQHPDRTQSLPSVIHPASLTRDATARATRSGGNTLQGARCCGKKPQKTGAKRPWFPELETREREVSIVDDASCVALLRWALPRLQLRWAGFRKVRRQVCGRIQRRMRALGCPDPEAYRAYLETHPDEWVKLGALCRIPISRFYRDRSAFDHLAEVVLPELARRAAARGENELRCWSAGCASGEEPYSLGLIWALEVGPRFPGLSLRIVATDVEPHLLQRAQRARYPPSSLKDLPPHWRDQAFRRAGDLYCLAPNLRAGVEFRLQDIRAELPPERFHLVLCRNLVFTYFEQEPQHRFLERLQEHLEPGGLLLLGTHEFLPPDSSDFAPQQRGLPIYVWQGQAMCKNTRRMQRGLRAVP